MDGIAHYDNVTWDPTGEAMFISAYYNVVSVGVYVDETIRNYKSGLITADKC
jgi:hypothetical protein